MKVVDLQPISFLSTSGLSVSDELASLFRSEAVKLFRARRPKGSFWIKDGAGHHYGHVEINTQGRQARFGNMHGVEFTLKVTLGPRSFDVSFIMNETYLHNPPTDGFTFSVHFEAPPTPDPRSLN